MNEQDIIGTDMDGQIPDAYATTDDTAVGNWQAPGRGGQAPGDDEALDNKVREALERSANDSIAAAHEAALEMYGSEEEIDTATNMFEDYLEQGNLQQMNDYNGWISKEAVACMTRELLETNAALTKQINNLTAKQSARAIPMPQAAGNSGQAPAATADQNAYTMLMEAADKADVWDALNAGGSSKKN